MDTDYLKELISKAFKRESLENVSEDDNGDPNISLCRNCWCMTHTLVGNICGKCKKPKHIVYAIGEENARGESKKLKEV